MNLLTTDNPALWPLATQYHDDGIVVIQGLRLPDTFEPGVTDSVFLKGPSGCDVFLGVNTAYRGASPIWHEIQSRPEQAGRTRLVATVPGDFMSGVNKLKDLLQEAGGMIAAEPAPPLPATGHNGDGDLTAPGLAAPRNPALQDNPPQDNVSGRSQPVQGQNDRPREGAPQQGMHANTPPPASTPRTAHALTDMEAVRRQIPHHERPLLVNEEELFLELVRRIRGQDHALRLLARGTARHLARTKPRGPATFFLLGPTGVGKTLSAETLPEALKALHPQAVEYGRIRLDMSEYQEEYRLSQLLGAPQGHVGYHEGAQLSDALAVNPRTFVILDEIEKAHPKILRALMNTFDQGRLSTAAPARGHLSGSLSGYLNGGGREIDCRPAVFCFTSNLNSEAILNHLEQRGGFDDAAVVNAVCRDHLVVAGIAPELVGRIGSFIVFRPLDLGTQAEILTLDIAGVAAEYGLEVGHIEPDVITAILETSRSRRFGARPNRFHIDELLGETFMNAANESIANAGLAAMVEVQGGPPFTCVPWTPDGTGSTPTHQPTVQPE